MYILIALLSKNAGWEVGGAASPFWRLLARGRGKASFGRRRLDPLCLLSLPPPAAALDGRRLTTKKKSARHNPQGLTHTSHAQKKWQKREGGIFWQAFLASKKM